MENLPWASAENLKCSKKIWGKLLLKPPPPVQSMVSRDGAVHRVPVTERVWTAISPTRRSLAEGAEPPGWRRLCPEMRPKEAQEPPRAREKGRLCRGSRAGALALGFSLLTHDTVFTDCVYLVWLCMGPEGNILHSCPFTHLEVTIPGL